MQRYASPCSEYATACAKTGSPCGADEHHIHPGGKHGCAVKSISAKVSKVSCQEYKGYKWQCLKTTVTHTVSRNKQFCVDQVTVPQPLLGKDKGWGRTRGRGLKYFRNGMDGSPYGPRRNFGCQPQIWEGGRGGEGGLGAATQACSYVPTRTYGQQGVWGPRAVMPTTPAALDAAAAVRDSTSGRPRGLAAASPPCSAPAARESGP